jgi:filamentous hemagglutinin family protein
MKNKSTISLSLRKLILSALVAAPMATLPAPLWALPQTGANVTSSSGTTAFTPIGTNTLNITETTATRLVLKWNNFGSGTSSIAAGESVIWTLPSTSSAVLNMVSSGATLVEGLLQSNGSIFILNQNGITLSSTATVNAAGFGVSTLPESEFFFLSNGNLGYVGTGTADINLNTSATGINVGSTGNVYVAARTAHVAGVINAGTLTVIGTNTDAAVNSQQSVRLGSSNSATAAALTVGTAGTTTTSGYGSLVVTSTGGNVVLSSTSPVVANGNSATITTNGGTVTQGTGRFSIGDGQSNATLTINTGTGAVTLGNIGSNNGTSGDNRRIGLTLTTGATTITSANRVTLNASTITGNLTVRTTNEREGSSIDNSGDVTVTGGTISLVTTGNNAAISFKGPGDLTFGTISTNATTGGNITLTSTTGAVALPALTAQGNLTVTAQTNITQTGTVTVNANTSRTATFDAVTGAITLTATANDFERVVLKNAPSGALIVDTDDLVLAGGTNVTGNVTITAPSGVALGHDSTGTVTIAGDLNIFTSLYSQSL